MVTEGVPPLLFPLPNTPWLLPLDPLPSVSPSQPILGFHTISITCMKESTQKAGGSFATGIPHMSKALVLISFEYKTNNILDPEYIQLAYDKMNQTKISEQ